MILNAPDLIGEVFERLAVNWQNDVALPQKAALHRWLSWEKTFNANHAAVIHPWAKMGNVEAEAESGQTLPQHHFVSIF